MPSPTGTNYQTVTIAGAWRRKDMGSAKRCVRYNRKTWSATGAAAWSIVGSNDETTWYLVARISGQNTNNNVVNQTVPSSYNQYAYRYYRWIEEAMVSGTSYIFNHAFGMFDENGNQLSSDGDYMFSLGAGDYNGGQIANVFYLDFDATVDPNGGTATWQESNNYVATGAYTGTTSMTVYDPTLPTGTAPPAPTSLSATTGNGSVSISFTQASDGGSAITNYKYSLNGGTFTALSPADTASPVVIGGLTNGVAYTIQLKAVNSLGDSDASASITVTPPLIISQLYGNYWSFTLSSAAAIASYGLGTYDTRMTIYSWYLLGSSDNSSWYVIDNKTTPVGYNSAYTTNFTLASPSTVYPYIRLVITAIQNTNSSDIWLYRGGFWLKRADGSFITSSIGVTSSEFANPYGTPYLATTTYTGSVGPNIYAGYSYGGGYLSPSTLNALYSGPDFLYTGTISSPTFIPPSVAPAPTSLVASAENRSVSISFTQASDGGSAISNYKYSLNGGSTFTAFNPADTTSPVVIGGLTNGATYNIQLKAVNSVGDSNASASITVTPPLPKQLYGNYWSFTLSSASAIASYGLGTYDTPMAIYKWALLGSNDNTEWNIIDRKTQTNTNNGNTTAYALSSPSPSYAYVRLVFEAYTNGNASDSFFYRGGFWLKRADGSFITSSSGVASSEFYTNAVPAPNLATVTNTGSVGPNLVAGYGQSQTTALLGVYNGPGFLYTGTVSSLTFLPPSAPTSLLATTGNGSVSISFTQASADGSSITNYKYSLNGGTFTALSPADTASPVVIGGLTNGTTYTIQLKGVNYLGDGDASASITVSLPIPIPLYGNYVSFTLSSAAAIASYGLGTYDTRMTFYKWAVLGSNDNTAWNLIDRKTQVNNTVYNTTAYTLSSPSATYAYVRLVFEAYTNTDAAANFFYMGGFWLKRADGSFITSSSGAPSSEFNPNGIPLSLATNTVTGQVGPSIYIGNGQANTTQLLALYSGPDFLYTGTVSSLTFIPPSVPPAPTSLAASAGNESVSISFTQASDGGSAITNYKYSLDNGSTFTAFSPADTASPVSITGLTNGVSYSIKLQAVNSLGDGAASATITVTPATIPDAPTNLVASYAGSGAVEISFTPGSNGGQTITNYQYSIDCGASFTPLNPVDGISPVSITGLTNGQAYCIELKALNSMGAGIASSSVQYTPYGPADAPTSLTWVDTLNGTISLSFTPGSNQGSAITNYEYSLDGGNTFAAFSPAQTTSPVSITGLNIRTHYSIVLRAVNSAGSGADSATLNMYYMCFLEGTKILCFNPETNQEEYRAIETLRKGSLVKTVDDGYKAIDMIGTSKIYNPGNSVRSKNRLYKCSKENYPSLTEDLFITGCHSILVKDISEAERAELMEFQGKIYITDNHYRLIAAVDKRAEPHACEGVFNIWHLALENENYYFNYGIYANGLLVETSSLRMMKEISGMDLVQ